VDGELELSLNGRNAPEMHISNDYSNMLKGYKEAREKPGHKRCSYVHQAEAGLGQMVYRGY